MPTHSYYLIYTRTKKQGASSIEKKLEGAFCRHISGVESIVTKQGSLEELQSWGKVKHNTLKIYSDADQLSEVRYRLMHNGISSPDKEFLYGECKGTTHQGQEERTLTKIDRELRGTGFCRVYTLHSSFSK